MKYYNINNGSERVSLKHAVLKSAGRVSDLYLPETIPVLPSQFFDRLAKMSLQQIAFEVSSAILGEDIPESVLESIVKGSLNFEIPLKSLSDSIFTLELFHGPTLAFKDVGARFLASLFDFYVQDENHEITILAATSGDTGSAVANAFFNKTGIRVAILYPEGKVSPVQEKQLATMGGNITAFEVNGTFDDCQRLVKLAFADKELNGILNLTSANSINFGRLFPQSFYYFYSLAQLNNTTKPVALSVPSGNFGNLTAGLIAKKMGLGINCFIASANSNHAVVDWLQTGQFRPHPSIQTITNAMDVGNPSNFPRMLALYNNGYEALKETLEGYWFTDAETRNGMKELQDIYKYQADPHGTVAYLGLMEYMKRKSCTGIFLETAHPAKFPDEVEMATNLSVKVPESLKKLDNLEKRSISLPNDFKAFRDMLTSHAV
jgi:threonine synthase